MMAPILSAFLAGSMRQAFEAASVKPTSRGNELTWGWCRGTDSSDREGPWIGGRILAGMTVPARPALGRCAITGATLKEIVRAAYDLAPTVEITGGPGWSDSDRFDIEAKAEVPSESTVAQLEQMLQQLLSERFQLKLHRETREVSGALLVVAGSGSKLKEAGAVNAPPVGGRPGDMNFQAAPMDVLAEFLSGILGRPIQDKTGLTGRYSFTLKWTVGENDLIPRNFDRPTDPAGPSLVTALQEQLGLRLQSSKVPGLVVVIDSAQKPSAN
jgi:uncharacterized protein (TIGR03435 family)